MYSMPKFSLHYLKYIALQAMMLHILKHLLIDI